MNHQYKADPITGLPDGGSKDICLVVGGGAGIGNEIAGICLGESWQVVVADMDVSRWQQCALANMKLVRFDIIDSNSRENLINTLEALGAKIKYLAFTIGRALTKPLNVMQTGEYTDLINLNCCSFAQLIGDLLAKDLFRKDGAGVIVISSLVGNQGARGKIAYSASKGALNSAVRSLAMELAPAGIRINAISPGTVHTDMLDRLISTIGKDEVKKLEQEFPLGLGDPRDVADLAVYLMSGMARWITGSVVTIDGGFGAR